jgi:hypothetical protein
MRTGGGGCLGGPGCIHAYKWVRTQYEYTYAGASVVCDTETVIREFHCSSVVDSIFLSTGIGDPYMYRSVRVRLFLSNLDSRLHPLLTFCSVF